LAASFAPPSGTMPKRYPYCIRPATVTLSMKCKVRCS
jgi:hypothetical protein